jgi:hypothetical protein
MIATSTSVKAHPWGILLLAGCLLAFATPAAAVTRASVPIRAEVNGTSDCQSPDAFLAQVQDRTSHARRARAGELGWSATITVKAVGARRLARLKLMATEGEWIERELVAPDCNDALEALAVVLAVLVDTAIEQSPPSEKASAGSSSEQPARPMALPRVATGVYIPWIDDPDYFEKRGISLSATRFVARIVGSAELDTQLTNKPSFGMGLGFEIERWSPTMLRPSFGLSLGWAPGEISNNGVSAELQRWSLRGHLCPFELLQGRVLSLRPCGRIEGGFVYVQPDGTGIVERLGMVRASPFLRLTLAPAAGAQLRLDGGLDLLALRRDIYVNGSRVYSPPALGAYAALAVAVEY